MLETALDCGITEERFWDMTFAEIARAVKSATRVKKIESQEKAYYDYILANLIAKGISKVIGGKDAYPTIEEAYNGLFEVPQEKKEQVQELKMDASTIRFIQFAQSHNKKFKQQEVVSKNE